QRGIPSTARLLCSSKTPVWKYCFDILTRLPGESDFEVMYRRRPVHRESGREAPAHQVDQDRRESALDDVPAHCPDDGLALFSRRLNSGHNRAQTVARKNARKRIEQPVNPAAGLMHARKVRLPDLAAARRERNRL